MVGVRGGGGQKVGWCGSGVGVGGSQEGRGGGGQG